MKKLLFALLFLSPLAHAGVTSVITLPAGRDKAVQYNDRGVFDGTSTFRFYESSGSLVVPNVQLSSITFSDGSTMNTAISGSGGGSPGGSSGQVQLNVGGSFGAALGLNYSTSTGGLTVGGPGAGASSGDVTVQDTVGSILHRITSGGNGVQFNVDSSARTVSFNKDLVTISSNVISASSAAITNVNVTNLKFNDGTTQTTAGGGSGGDSFGSHIATKTVTAGFGISATTAVFTSTLTITGSTVQINGLTYKWPGSASGTSLLPLYNATTSTLAWTSAITDAAQLGSAQTFTNRNTFSGNTILESSVTVKAVVEPGTPASGYGVLYLKNSDSILYFKGADGTAHDLLTGGTGGADSLGSHVATKTVTMGYGFSATTGAFSSDVTFSNVSTMTFSTGSKLDISSGVLKIPSGVNLPGICQVGDFFMDTDATSGQRLYACESANTWVLQGGSGSGGADSFGSHIATKTVTMGYGYTATTATLSDLATFNSSATFNSQVLNNNVSTVTFANVRLRMTGTSAIEWADSTVQVSSGSGGGGGTGDITDVTAGYGLSGGGTSGAVTLNLATDSTSYIRNSNTLVSGTTFYVSSGSIKGPLRFADPTADAPDFLIQHGTPWSSSYNGAMFYAQSSTGPSSSDLAPLAIVVSTNSYANLDRNTLTGLFIAPPFNSSNVAGVRILTDNDPNAYFDSDVATFFKPSTFSATVSLNKGLRTSTGTFTGQVSVGSIIFPDGTVQVSSPAAATAASILAVTTGSATGFSATISSPTSVVNFSSDTFRAQLTGSATAFITLNSSSVTLLGQSIPAANIAAGSLGASVVASSVALSGFYSNSTVRSNLGLAIGSNVQAWDADLDDLADGSLSGSKVGSGVAAGNIASGSLASDVVASSVALAGFYSDATVRSNLGLAIGTNVQAWDADLDDLADGSLSGSKVGSGIAAANIASGSLGSNVVASSVALSGFYSDATVRSNLGLAIGTNVQAWDTDLDDLADGSLSGSKVGSGVPAANIASGSLGANVVASSVALSGFYSNATVRSNLGLAIGTDVQAWDADLDDLADGSLSGSKVGSGVPAANIATGSLGSNVMASSVALSGFYSDATIRSNLGLAIGTNVQAWDADLDDLADGSLTGSKVGSGVPAANIAAGSLGSSVLASSFPVTGVTAGSYTHASITVDAQGRLSAASSGASSGGDNFGNHIATRAIDMASFSISNIGTSSSSFDSNGGLVVASSFTIQKGFYSPPVNFTPLVWTMTSTMTTVTANATSTSRSTGTLPSAGSTATGQTIDITKIDTSTQPVVILPASGDTIVGLSTITLQAYGSTVRLQAKAANTWFPINYQGTPAFYGNNGDVASAAAGVASTTYHQAIYVTSPCDTKQITFNVGTNSGSVDFGIYDQFGTLVLSSGPFIAGGTGTRTVAMQKVNLQPGLYYTAFGADNGTITFTRYASNMLGAGMYSKASNLPFASSIGYPPVFDNSSARSPALTLSCWGAAP